MHRFRAVVLGVRKRTIWPNLGRRAGATALLVLLAAVVMLMAALPGGPFVSRAASAPIASSTLLAPDALDGRMADDGVTPIAVRGDGEIDGSPVVYGARPYDPIVLDLNAAIPGTRYFVDCSQPTNGNGTQASPFNALDSVNALTLQPGDQVLLKTGVACTGMLQPQGSGTADAPIHLDSYGPNDIGMARIDANGNRQAILLQNVEHYVVRNLELTNRTGDARDMNENRHGLDVELLDFGQATGFEVTGLYIHDVLGAAEVEWTPDEDNCLASGGICFDVLDSDVRSTYSDVEISFNTIRHVNRIGIALRSGTNERPEGRNDGFANWSPWDPFSIHDNFLTDIGGDGMIVSMASGSTVDHNTVERSGSELGEDRLNGPTAALWAWAADRVTFAYNHVFGTERHLDNGDGTAFDADHSSTEMVFEHNLSHDNEGGFLMFCGCYGISTKTAVRYNISLNDGLAVPLDPELGDETARTFKLAGQTDGEVYNNTVLLPATDIDIAHQGDPSNSPIKNSVVFLNNVWLAQEGTQVHESASTWSGNVIPWRSNVFGGTATGWPQGPLANIVSPDLAPVAGSGLAALQLQSEEILARGAPVAPEGVTDVRGVPVPWVTPPDNGAWQYTATDPASQVTVQNGGFSAGVTGWTLDGAAVAETPTEAPGLQVTFPGAAGSASQTVSLAVNRTYELLARVHGTGAGNAAVSVLLPSGATVIAEPAGAAVAEGYVAYRAVFRTAEDASTAVLTVSASGGAAADDIQLVPVDDRMVDGSFEALENTVWQLNLNGEMSDPPLRSSDATSGFRSAELTASLPSVDPVTYVEPGADYTLTVFAKAQPGKTVRLSWSGMIPGENGTIQTSSTQWVQLTLPLRSTATPETSSPVTVSCAGTGLCDDMTLVRAFDGTVPRVDAEYPSTAPITVNYVVSDANIPNPQRGFDHTLDTEYYPDDTGYTPLDAATLAGYRDDGITLVVRPFYLEKFVDNPVIDDAYLALVQADFDTARAAGISVIPRFAYTPGDGSYSTPYGDAPLDIVLAHIHQLGPILRANADVIPVVQNGFVGLWGEGYYTDYFADPTNPENVSAADWANRAAVTNALLDELPADRAVQVRTMQWKERILSLEASADSAVTADQAFTDTPLSRIGFHDDCFGASEDDLGTFLSDPISLDQEYLAADSLYVPVGGETCMVSEYSDWPGMSANMARYHFSYLNIDYNQDVLASWGDEGMQETAKRLGYRFVMTSSTVTPGVDGTPASVSVNVRNDGWAAPFTPRNAVLELTAADGTVIDVPFTENADARRWLPGTSTTISVSLGALPAGTYSLALTLRAPEDRIAADPRYAVQTANVGTWDAETGVNKLGQTLTVSDTVPLIPGPSAEDIAESDHLLTGHAVAVTSPPLQFSAGDPAADPVTLVGAQVTRVGDDTDPAALAAAGSVTIDATAKTVTFAPGAGTVGPLEITYTVADAFGRTATAVIPVVVLAQPVANAATLQVEAGGSGEVNVLANDVLDTAAGGVYLVSVATSGSGAPAHGTVSVDAATGLVTYTAGGGVAGVQDTFSYTVTDQFGVAASSTVTVTIAAAEAAGEVTTFVQKIARDVSNQWVPMGGSAWTVLSDQSGMPGSNANGVTVAAVSGATGLFQVDHLQANTVYWLMEAQAPEGFALLAEPIRFSVDDAGAVTLLAAAGGSSGGAGTVVSQAPADPSSAQAPWSIITVRDVPTVQLPMTGGNLLAPLSVIGWLLLAVGALGGMLLWRRRSTPSR